MAATLAPRFPPRSLVRTNLRSWTGSLGAGRTHLSLAFGLLRFGAALRAYLRDSLTLAQAEAAIHRGMEVREAALLRLLERAVFAHAGSPYRQLFRAAGCEPGDVQRLVEQEGVEGSLQRLLTAGIYVSYEEFKGRAPAVRGSQTFTFRTTDFDNPLVTPHLFSGSGGSRGTPTRILFDVEHLTQSAPHWAVWFAAHNVMTSPLIFLTPYYPGIVNRQLLAAKFGNRFVKWFSLGGGGTPVYRLVTAYVHAVARWMALFPPPERVSPTELGRVADYLAGLVREGQTPAVVTSPSDAARVCLAAQARGRPLQQVTFLLCAEPLTAARRLTIEAAGARAVPTYGCSEGGNIGSQCPNATLADDVHVSLDAYAVIGRGRLLGDEDRVDALLLTGLRPACPKTMLNVEIGDYAVRERRRCGCSFDELGYYEHLHTIRSFDKLTGHGVTFLGDDLTRLIEAVLPSRFGGTLADYQLIEEQNQDGLARYRLLVSPELPGLDSRAVKTTFLSELGKLRRHYAFMVRQWEEAEAFRVERRQPVRTARGKLLPFRVLGRQE